MSFCGCTWFQAAFASSFWPFLCSALSVGGAVVFQPFGYRYICWVCLISLREIFNAGLERNSEGTLALRLFQVCRCLRLKNAYILYIESRCWKTWLGLCLWKHIFSRSRYFWSFHSSAFRCKGQLTVEINCFFAPQHDTPVVWTTWCADPSTTEE